MIRRLTATTFLRPATSGRNAPLFCGCVEAADGPTEEFVVKILDVKQGALLELVGSRLATHFGILVPEAIAVHVGADFVALLTSDSRFCHRAQLFQSNIGLNFASRYLSPVAQWQSGRKIPDALLSRAVDIYAFDALTQNPDRRAINPNLFIMGDEIYVYDHETSFSFLQAILPSPKPWIVEHEPYLKEHIFYAGLKGRKINIGNFLKRLVLLSDGALQGIRDEVPQEWMHDCLDLIEVHLRSVRAHAEEFGVQVQRSLL
jgi:hypothetical protein